ncbi:MAG: type II secretion system F family protein [Candidatus Nanopelagicales bacterium]|nr:type II secretion system F family protein [Candidatus Nanopelagicales bacterium]MCF8557976.1 type II secretion system F family protein [Candidatus Nanopelagicales bacterium]
MSTPVGAAIGVLAGVALVLLWRSVVDRRPVASRESRTVLMIRAAGIEWLTSGSLIALSAAAAVLTGLFSAAMTGLPVVGLLGFCAGACTPTLVIRRRASRRAELARGAWPDAVDALVSGVRAGMSLPEAMSGLATAGPEALRPLFSVVALEYRATGSFTAALDRLSTTASDPVADRVVVALRLSREFGGTSVGETLRTLSAMLREDARIRSEIHGRQSWTVSAARLAVAAPWVTLVLLSTRGEAAQAYASASGVVIIVMAAVLSAAAYLLMLRIARLPQLHRLAT